MQFHDLFHAGSLEELDCCFFLICFLDYMLTFLLADRKMTFFSPEPISYLFPLSKHSYVFFPGLLALGWSSSSAVRVVTDLFASEIEKSLHVVIET